MSKFRKLSVSSFKGDKGWKLRETYNDLVKDIEKYVHFFVLKPKTVCSTITYYETTCLVVLYTSLYQTALHCTALHGTALHCTALHCTALQRSAAQRSA